MIRQTSINKYYKFYPGCHSCVYGLPPNNHYFSRMLSYRKDIDGLRAVAVLSVLLYHYHIPGFAGGFIGVDIFFAISGYLIGSIILSGLQQNSFSFAEFYERRIRRILPALYTLIIACLLFSLLTMDSSFLKGMAKTAGSTILFISNIFFYKTTGGYFTLQSGEEIFTHTWSLSLEEQFYFIFPPLIFLVNKYARKYILHFILAIFLLSLATSIFMSQRHSVFSFFLPPARVWEFAAGILIAKTASHNTSRIFKEGFYVAGILLLVAGLIKTNESSVFPGYIALLPVAGACCILYSGKSSLPATSKILSWQPLVFIGKISYSLYLWHWPVKLFSEYIFPDPLPIRDSLILFTFTFILSFLSWKFIEQPFRKKNEPAQRKKLFFGTAIITLCILALCLLINISHGFPARLADDKFITEMQNDTIWRCIWKYDFLTRQVSSKDTLPVIGSTHAEPDFLLWGDSHAGMLVPGFEAACMEKNKSGYIAVTIGDPPVFPGHRATNNPALAVINSSIVRFVAMHSSVRKIFLFARWNVYRQTSIIENAGKDTSGNKAPFDKELASLIDSLTLLNREVVIIAPIPDLDTKPRNYFYQSKFQDKGLNSLTPTREQFIAKNKNTNIFLHRLTKSPLVTIVYPDSLFFKEGKIRLRDEDHFLFIDTHHLSTWGSLKLKDFIKEQL